MNPRLETVIQLAKLAFGLFFVYVGYRILAAITAITPN